MNTWNRLLIGAISGIVATGPMTVAMILMHRRLPARERYPLPPREIAMKLAGEAHLREHMSEEVRSATTMLSHFGYGAACGALYTGTVEPRRQTVLRGVLFGIAVWMGSYLGWLPATGILSSATEHPERRNALMIGAHVVWGIVLSGMAALLASEMEEEPLSPFSSAVAPHRDAEPVSRR
jgi:uncharacterized membrane protein YagU involved in acid resistance